ncbi:MAG TPA: hypothetical protein VFH45_09030, partial [Acidimicrobiales bacterium]|nr:hypothetical protein [Acidimicrobiales bacterium]
MQIWEHRLSLGDGEQYLAMGAGGWAFWHVGLTGRDLRVRVVVGPHGRLVVATLWLDAPDDFLTATELRRLPLGRLEETLNST